MTLRHNKTIIQMVKDGWNFNQIQELFKESKAFEREIVRERNYFESHRIKNFSKVKSYYCMKCQRFHYKYRYVKINGFSERKETKSFKKCQKHAISLTQSEQFNFHFTKKWKNYDMKAHKTSVGSKLQ